MPSASWKFFVDFSNSGLFNGAYDDITAYVASAQYTYGRDYASMINGRSIAGLCSLNLLNSDGRFNSFLTTGPMYGNILPGRRVKLTSTYLGNTVTQWQGYLDSIEPLPSPGGSHMALLRALGPLSQLASVLVNVSMKTNIQTGIAVTEVLDQISWPAADRSIDTGRTTMARWWTGGQIDALTALSQIESTEFGFIRETKNGKIAFDDRYHRAGETSQATFSDVVNATLGYDVRQIDSIKEIANIVTADIVTYTVTTSAVLWTLGETGSISPSILAGASRDFWASYPGAQSALGGVAVDAWTTPVATTDFLANDSPLGSGTDLTSSITVSVTKFDTAMKITLTNTSGSTAYMTFMQARGTAVMQLSKNMVQSANAASQAKYKNRTYALASQFLPSSDEGQKYTDYVLSRYKDPVPILEISFMASRSSPLLTEALTRDIDDQITVVGNANSKLGINEDFLVESITHRLEDGQTHYVTYQLSPASVLGAFWLLGTSVLGTGTILADLW